MLRADRVGLRDQVSAALTRAGTDVMALPVDLDDVPQVLVCWSSGGACPKPEVVALRARGRPVVPWAC